MVRYGHGLFCPATEWKHEHMNPHTCREELLYKSDTAALSFLEISWLSWKWRELAWFLNKNYWSHMSKPNKELYQVKCKFHCPTQELNVIRTSLVTFKSNERCQNVLWNISIAWCQTKNMVDNFELLKGFLSEDTVKTSNHNFCCDKELRKASGQDRNNKTRKLVSRHFCMMQRSRGSVRHNYFLYPDCNNSSWQN